MEKDFLYTLNNLESKQARELLKKSGIPFMEFPGGPSMSNVSLEGKYRVYIGLEEIQYYVRNKKASPGNF